MKRILSILLCAVMVFALVACGTTTDNAANNSTDTQEPAPTKELTQGADQNVVSTISEDETLTVAIEGEPPFIMPNSGSAGNPTSYVLNCMVETLYEFDPVTGGVKARLADELEWVDETHFRVTINPNAKFANGDPVTAEDVAYSFQLAHSLSGGSSYYTENYKAIDDKTVEFELINPYVNAAYEVLAKQGTKVYSKKVLDAMGYPDEMPLQPDAANPGNSGKFVFKEWVPGQYILLERNENYWMPEEMAYYKYMKFVFVADAAARAMAVESGDADVASYITASMGAAYEGSEDVTPYYIDTGLAGTFMMNQGNPDNPDSPLKNEKVRQAIRLLIDPQAVNDLANAGMGTICETSLSPKSEAYVKIDIDRTVNIEEAKKLLAEAGYPDGFTLEATNIAPYKAQGDVIKEALRLGGITWDAELQEIPAHFATARTGKYDCSIRSYSCVDYTEFAVTNDGRHSPAQQPAMNVYTGDAEWEAICDRVYYTQDPEARLEAFAEAQQYAVDHCLMIGLCTTIRLELVRAGLSAPTVNGAGTVYYQDMRPLA